MGTSILRKSEFGVFKQSSHFCVDVGLGPGLLRTCRIKVEEKEEFLVYTVLRPLTRHTYIESDYPNTKSYGINRRFKVEWAKNHPWLHYSMSEDGVYCKACALFAPSDIRRDYS